jgi:hypothetical protein
MAAGSIERTSGYFGDQTPSESKNPVFRSAFGFIISGAPHFRNPYLTKVTNQLGSTLRRPRHPFDISRTFEITVSIFHHYLKCLNHDLLYYNRPVQKCNLSDPRRALVYGRFLGILFILSFCHREFFSFK